MGDLQNKLISQTYDALIQTGTDEPIDGTLRPLQDGSGQNLPIEVSTTGVNFTGTVTGIPAGTDTTYDLASAQSGSDVDVTLTGSDATIDTVKLVAGTNITLTDNGANNITIDAAGGGGGSATNSFMDAYKPANMNGWDSTKYYFTSRPIHGNLNWYFLNDQGPNSIQLGWLFVEPGKTITEICLPLKRVTQNLTYLFGIYDTYDSGGPRNRVINIESIPVNFNNNVNGNQYVEHTLSSPWTPTEGMYYFAVQCTQSNTPLEYDNTIAIMSRSDVGLNVVNISPDGGQVSNLYQSGVIQTNTGGPMPATFDEGQTFAEREEQLVLLFR